MFVKRHYHIWSTVRWSKNPLINAFFYSLAVILFYEITGIPFSLPWQPISVIGIAVAFYLGFKNNSSYDRAWEARKIWGAIVNDSRSMAIGILSLPNPEVSFEWKKTVHLQAFSLADCTEACHAKGKILGAWHQSGKPDIYSLFPRRRNERSIS